MVNPSKMLWSPFDCVLSIFQIDQYSKLIAVVQRDRETGNFVPNREREDGPGRPQCNLATEDHILDIVEENRGVSRRQLSRQVSFSFCGGHLKNEVYHNEVNIVEELK